MITHRVSTAGYQVQEWDPAEVRTAIATAEKIIEKMPQVALPVIHRFCDGIYIREIFIPKGTVMTGRLHKQTDSSLCLGVCEVVTPTGWKRLESGSWLLSSKGVKPIVLAIEDTRWITHHATTLTDLDEIEKALFEDEGECPLDFKTGKPTAQFLTNGGE